MTPKKEIKEWQEVALDIGLSGASALISKTLVAPFERVKLVLQTQSSNTQILSNQNQRYDGILDCFSRMSKEQGILSFWRGHLSTLLKYVPLQVLNFTTHSKLKRMFPQYSAQEQPGKFFATNMMKGALAGGSSILVVYPLDYIKTRMATDLGKSLNEREFTGFTDCIKTIYRRGGLSSFYTAFPLSFFTVMLYRSIYFGFFETAKRDSGSSQSMWSLFFYAQLSTNSAGFVVYPIDTVRRNMVIQSGKSRADKKILQDDSILQCARRIYSERGIKGLYAGCLINLLRGFGGSLVLVIYETLKNKTSTKSH